MSRPEPTALAGVAALEALCPVPPDWVARWEAAVATLPLLDRLRDCPQDPVHHAEGDAGTHTRMACEALASMPAWQAMPADERTQVFIAILLHDIAKPDCTRIEPDGRVTAHGHSGRGERIARRLLWELSVPPAWREHIANLVRHHQVPFWALERPDPARTALLVSHTTRCDHLALLARADIIGRNCADRDEVLERIDLFQALCEELDCWNAAYPFASDHARFAYFRTPGRDPAWAAFDDTRTQALLLSGLPGSGKDHWLGTAGLDWPVISLDAIRVRLGVAPTRSQHAVVDAAYQTAREHLRRGQPFVWNATNLTRRLRLRLIGVCHSYHARVHVVAVETTAATLRARDQVPGAALDRMLRIWEAPDPTEAHQLTRVVRGA